LTGFFFGALLFEFAISFWDVVRRIATSLAAMLCSRSIVWLHERKKGGNGLNWIAKCFEPSWGKWRLERLFEVVDGG
jgi:hypothetical protein